MGNLRSLINVIIKFNQCDYQIQINVNCEKCGLLTVRRGKMKRHIKAVHRDGCFDMKTWI